MIKLNCGTLGYSHRALGGGVLQQQSVLSQDMLQFLKKKYQELKMKFRTLKAFKEEETQEKEMNN